MTTERAAAAKAVPHAAPVLVGTAMALRVDLPGAAPVPRDAVSKVRAQKGDVLIVAAPKAGRIARHRVRP